MSNLDPLNGTLPADPELKVLSEEESKSFTKWSMPMMSDSEDVIEQVKDENEVEEELEPEVELVPQISPEELEEIRQKAFDEAFEEGKAKGLDEGLQSGFEEGKKLGYKEAFDLAQGEIKEQTSSVQAIIDGLQKPLELISQEVETEILNLSVVIAKHIIRKELDLDPKQIQPYIKEAIQLLPSSVKSIKIHCHPQDHKLIKLAIKQLDDDDLGQVKYSEDDTIERGGFKIDSDCSLIDATLETRFEELIKSFIPDSSSQENNKDIEKISDESETLGDEQSNEQSSERSNEQSSEQSNEQSSEQSSEQSNEVNQEEMPDGVIPQDAKLNQDDNENLPNSDNLDSSTDIENTGDVIEASEENKITPETSVNLDPSLNEVDDLDKAVDSDITPPDLQ